MKNAISIDSIRALIEEIKGAERITKKALAQVSRDLIQFVFLDRHDRIELVNECLGALSPMNKKVAIKFFRHFLPWGFNERDNRFEAKFQEGKKTERKLADATEFMADNNNTIWTWAEANIDVEFKVPNYSTMIANNIANALKGKKDSEGNYHGAITVQDAIQAVMAGGIDSEQILDMVANLEALKADKLDKVQEDMQVAH